MMRVMAGTIDELMRHRDDIHTTELGAIRIRRNLALDVDDVVGWCRSAIASPRAHGERVGKNWYVSVDDCVITVNASSYTIITAHRRK